MICEKEKSQKKPVHERLYKKKESTEKIGSFSTFNDAENSTFAPLIQRRSKILLREEKVEDLLYKDAIRRSSNSTKNTQIQSKTQIPEISLQVFSNNSNKILEKKFLKQFSSVLPARNKFDYISLHEVMKKLGFILSKNENDSSVKERTLLLKIWTYLDGEENKEISRRNLAVFLLAILGLPYSGEIEFDEDVEMPSKMIKDSESEDDNSKNRIIYFYFIYYLFFYKQILILLQSLNNFLILTFQIFKLDFINLFL